MTNKRWGAGVLLGATLAAAGCGSAPVYAHGVTASVPAASPRPYGTADTAFGLDLMGAWCRPSPQFNRVFSPSSLASGLGMAYLGARGSTAKTMAAVLHLPAAEGRALESGLHARSAALHDLNGPGVTVLDSDQVWTDPSLQTLPSYLNSVATAYGASVAKVPLLKNSPAAARQINAAIAAATRGKIPQLFAGNTLGAAPLLGWVLTDVLYLNAAWATPFQASQTVTGAFTTANGQQVGVRYLRGGPFRTVRTDGWTAVSLPYRDGRAGHDRPAAASRSQGLRAADSGGPNRDDRPTRGRRGQRSQRGQRGQREVGRTAEGQSQPAGRQHGRPAD